MILRKIKIESEEYSVDYCAVSDDVLVFSTIEVDEFAKIADLIHSRKTDIIEYTTTIIDDETGQEQAIEVNFAGYTRFSFMNNLGGKLNVGIKMEEQA